MTPKEKAEDLLLTYSILEDGQNHLVKKCALITVDKIMDALDKNGGGWDFNYWEEVKQEIEKL
jgi:hypothetical protein